MTRWGKKNIGKRIHYFPLKRKNYVAFQGIEPATHGSRAGRRFQGIRLIRDRNDLDSLSPDLTKFQMISAYNIREARDEAKRMGVLE